MESGRVVEDGAAGELRESGYHIERMWRMQAEGLLAEANRQAAQPLTDWERG